MTEDDSAKDHIHRYGITKLDLDLRVMRHLLKMAGCRLKKVVPSEDTFSKVALLTVEAPHFFECEAWMSAHWKVDGRYCVCFELGGPDPVLQVITANTTKFGRWFHVSE